MTTDPLVGALLDGRYRIEARIANGGMSTVYRGLDVRLGRPVALKVMDARYAGDHQFLTRFHREARAIASLKHPGLVAIYDQGNDPAHPFLVMELIEGGTLRELLRERGPMPPHAVVAVLRPLLGGLGVAHRAGLVHRDIKPENVLISDDGEVKLVDFGLVKLLSDDGAQTVTILQGRGTAAYTPLEQYGEDDSHTDGRSDLYALGATLFHLLTNTTPPEAKQRFLRPDALRRPTAINSQIGSVVEQAILDAMAMHPDDRPATVAEFRNQLFNGVPDLPTTEAPLTQEHPRVALLRHNAVWLAAAAVAVAAGLFVTLTAP